MQWRKMNHYKQFVEFKMLTPPQYQPEKTYFDTADFIKMVLSVYTYLMTTIYLSLSAQVARSTFFMKSPV